MGSPLTKLWRDRCTIFVKEKHTDPVTKITDFTETAFLTDEPCKLSFESIAQTGGDNVAAIAQRVKLFLSPEHNIPAGCKIEVTRLQPIERTFTYAKSGEPGVFTNHQEVELVPFKGYA